MKKLLITIDGPAGAGKTTVAKALAAKLGYTYIDTGALYRGVALASLRRGVSPDDETGLRNLCREIELRFLPETAGGGLLLDGEDISEEIRTPAVTMRASEVSASAGIRECLLSLQRELARNREAVVEGRDMGTVVFPNADIKFFLEAKLETRAKRRYLELSEKTDQNMAEVERDMAIRDHNDSTRRIAPLKPALDAFLIDSSDLAVTEVVHRMLARIQDACDGPVENSEL